MQTKLRDLIQLIQTKASRIVMSLDLLEKSIIVKLVLCFPKSDLILQALNTTRKQLIH